MQGDKPVLLWLSRNKTPIPAVHAICEKNALEPYWLGALDDFDRIVQLGKPVALAWDLENARPGDWSIVQKMRSYSQYCQLPLLLFQENTAGKLSDQRNLTNVLLKPAGNQMVQHVLNMLPQAPPRGEIWIIDDDPRALEYYEELIGASLAEYHVRKIHGGREAVRLLDQAAPDLVLLDLVMPDVDGFQVLERLRSILPSRALDIGLAEFGGVPLCWLSPNGEAHPAFYDDRSLAWLRTAVGGLLMTCGLTQVGSPGVDGGEELGLHGRAHHTPARQVGAEGYWEEDEYFMVVRGQVEETSIFGWNLRLTRRITSSLGKNEIAIRDVVENAGFEPAPYMMLYHFNFGFPLLDAGTEVHFPSGRLTPREPEVPIEGLENWQSPQPGYRERVYYHENLSTMTDGMAAVTLRNPHFPAAEKPLTVRLAWKVDTLPVLVQWKMPGEGTHVLGIEPANCHVEGRAAERERGTLVMLPPGQTIEHILLLTILEE